MNRSATSGHRVRTALLAALALQGCGGAPAPFEHVGQDLLQRTPDVIVEQPGRLVPDPETQWGRFGLDGWLDATEERDGRAFVWCRQPTARLRLPTLAERDRTIEATFWLPAPADPAAEAEVTAEEGPIRAEVRLNGKVLETLEPTLEPATHRLFAPAPLWLRGENVLEIQVNRMRETARGILGLALAEVVYDEPLPVEIDLAGGRARLLAGAGLRYHVELLGETQLALAGRAEGTGELEVRFAFMDPETGLFEGRDAPPLRVAPASGGESGSRRYAASLELPDPEGHVLEVELSWAAPEGAGSRIDLERLELLEATPAERPPIVFISIDTLAARNMSLYGYGRETTPHIDAFAREAVVFESARANAPFTLQSYLSQLSGLYPPANRLALGRLNGRMPGPWERDQLAPNRWTLAEMLRGAGYRTGAWVDNPWLARGFGFQQGFEHYDVSAAEVDHRVRGGGLYLNAPLAEEWIRSQPGGQPFFAFVQALDPHGPYLPDPPFRGRFHGDEHYDDEHEAMVGVDQLHAFGMVPSYVAEGVYEHAELPRFMKTGQLVAAYDEKVLQTDDRIGRFLEFLKEVGVYDRAVIVLSADHGESMLDHDFYFDHGTLYDEVLGIPLVVRLPGGRHAGRVVSQAVQMVDLFPTLADLIGVPRRGYLHGASLLDLLEGAPRPPQATYAEGGIMDQETVVFQGWKLIRQVPARASFQTMLTHPRMSPEWVGVHAPELLRGLRSTSDLQQFFEEREDLKRALVGFMLGPFYELYYLPDDPREQNDLSAERPDKLREMIGVMDSLAERAERARRHASLTPPEELDEARRAQLSALGYLPGAGDADGH